MSRNNHFIDFPIFQAPEYGSSSDSYRGENQQGILILFSSSEDTEALNTFLSKVLAAVKLDIHEDVLLLPLPDDKQIHLSSLVRKKKVRTAIIFGISGKRLGAHFAAPLYQPITSGSLRCLLAHSLTDIYAERQQGGKQKAGALWRGLQSLFL